MYGGSFYALADDAYPADMQAAARAGTLQPIDYTNQNSSYASCRRERHLHGRRPGHVDASTRLGQGLQRRLPATVARRACRPRIRTSPTGRSTGMESRISAFGPNAAMYYHGGELPGFNSFMGYDPDNDVALVIWTNLTLSPDGKTTAQAMLPTVLDEIYAGLSPSPTPAPTTPDDPLTLSCRRVDQRPTRRQRPHHRLIAITGLASAASMRTPNSIAICENRTTISASASMSTAGRAAPPGQQRRECAAGRAAAARLACDTGGQATTRSASSSTSVPPAATTNERAESVVAHEPDRDLDARPRPSAATVTSGRVTAPSPVYATLNAASSARFERDAADIALVQGTNGFQRDRIADRVGRLQRLANRMGRSAICTTGTP